MHEPEQSQPFFSLDDALLSPEQLDLIYPPGCRDPDWRDLLAPTVWWNADGESINTDTLDAREARDLLSFYRDHASVLHAQAVADEQETLSSALQWALLTLGVRTCKATHPRIWLETLPLIRGLERHIKNRS